MNDQKTDRNYLHNLSELFYCKRQLPNNQIRFGLVLGPARLGDERMDCGEVRRAFKTSLC